ncbi:MAG: Spo0E family sporulation regulatory protein-aspartic acid phosphatase [Caldicoprobacterales bacterium]
MTELVILLKSIEKLRKQLNDLINAKSLNLQDPEIIAASEILDDAIFQI